MPDDLSQIQSRIGEIQARLNALSRPAAPVNTPTIPFSDALTSAQQASAVTLPPAPSGISVPLAALGPTPISSDALVPMPVKPVGDYDGLVQTYAEKHGLPASLVKAVIQTESGGDTRAISRAGAMGLMQLMPENVKEAGIGDAFDPEQNIAAGTAQLANLMKTYGGDLDLTLAGYNAGPGNVRKYGGVPPFAETQNYIRKVKAAMGAQP